MSEMIRVIDLPIAMFLIRSVVLVSLYLCLSAASAPRAAIKTPAVDAMPYRQFGLSTREAAAHLLSRCTWGVRREDIDEAEKVGLEQWFETQLSAHQDDTYYLERIKNYKTLQLSNAQIAATYPTPGKVLLELMQKGVYKDVDALKNLQDSTSLASKNVRAQALKYAFDNGYRPQRELLGEMIASKLLRAVYSQNQLHDVLSDFWMNHFCVSMVKTPARQYIPTYERDVIRPGALGRFHDLLVATAQHPAMLLYLDNAQSTSPIGCPTTASIALDSIKNMGGIKGWFARRRIAAAEAKSEELRSAVQKNIPEEFRSRRGINENYARELLELHTLGVDGGYTQSDVTNLARVLSGWTMMPLGYAKNGERLMDMIEKGKKIGVVVQGDFLFRADAHDATAKDVLGLHFVAGGAMNEGLDVLRALSVHPSTAHRIALKLCTRFVSDQPSERLVQRVAQVFKEKNGDIKEMMRCIVYSDEFWDSNALRSKIKSPFELIVSTLRVTHADPRPTKELYDWSTRLGQQVYASPAPTGFADNAGTWVNSGSLINRMNFAQAISINGIKGIHCEVDTTMNVYEPESQKAALEHMFAKYLPERELNQSVALLLPMLNDSTYTRRLLQANNRKDPPDLMDDEQVFSDLDMQDALAESGAQITNLGRPATKAPQQATSTTTSENSLKSNASKAQELPRLKPEQFQRHLMALVLGSPEFQRR